MCECDEDEKVTKISNPNPDSDGEIKTDEEPFPRPVIAKDANERNRDPVGELRKKNQIKEKIPCVCVCKDSILIEPTVSRRMDIKYVNTGTCDDDTKFEKRVYEYPPTKKFLYLQKKNVSHVTDDFCDWPNLNVNKPLPKRKIDAELDVPSPEASCAKVPFKKTCPSPSILYPECQPADQLESDKPKSGLFLNEKENDKKFEDYDSFDLVYKKKPRPPWPSVDECTKKGKKSKKGGGGAENRDENICYCEDGGQKRKSGKKKKKDQTDDELELEGKGGEPEDADLTKMFRRKVSLMSAATSYNSKDYPLLEEAEFPPGIAKILQKFKRESDIKRFGPQRRKFKRGTLESHSFTDICQPTLRDFFFGSKEGTMHQGDESFSDRIRDKQGVCMPVAAFCYSIIKHPNKWTRENVDDILIYGNNLLIQSLDETHIHNLKRPVNINVLRKYITIGDKKLRFHIGEPDIAGYIRSDDKTVYNITKALSIFFHRHNSGIIKTKHLSIGIWKQKYLYMFDAKARTKDLYCSPTGAAIMAIFYDVPSLATVLLTRSNFGNWPFAIHPLKVYRVIPVNEPEIDSQTGLDIRSEYNILNENKAVVLGSFDLGDKCFDFSRYKQSLTMAVIALVYSRLTPPSAWHRKTVDKILIIGNLLYRECICCTTTEEVKLENIPAIFTVGPYIVEIYIFGNVFADVIYRSCVCQLQTCLDSFFTKCTNAILQFGKCHLAVWKQRNMFYCFDPYSRDNEAYSTRDGCACVSMHSTLESLIETIVRNFDKDSIFYIHALKVCKIHRDPVQSTHFPKHVSMDEFPLDCFKNFKMKKSKKNATEKPVTVDYTAIAMRRLLAGESPHASIVEIGSNVESLAMDQLYALMKKCPSKPCVAFHPIPREDIADLDSASLEDTQIEPPLPQQIDEGIELMDLDSFGPTMDELEMEGEGEAEQYGEYEADVEGILMDEIEGMFGEEGEGGWYYGKTGYSQYDMAGGKMSAQINTEITYFPIKRDILYPTCIKNKLAMKTRIEKSRLRDDDWENYLPPCPPNVTKSQELGFQTNFVDLPDNTQIILGTKNVAELGDTVEYIAPFVCIMAAVVARKYHILTWTREIVDYVLKCGGELYCASKFRYDQVSKLEIPRITLGTNVYTVLVEYVFDSYTRQNILELALDKILFVRSNTGVIVTPTYACGVMFRNHLYYLYDPFGNNELGHSEGPGTKGVAVFARFKDIHSLANRIMFNKKKRENNEEIIYSRFVLSTVKVKGVYDYGDSKKKEKKKAAEGEGEKKGSQPKLDKGSCGDQETPEGPENKVGYRCEEGLGWFIVGTKNLPDRTNISEDLKEDHFMCICACLMLMTTPVEKWSTKKVDLAFNYGTHVHSHATDLLISEKRTIRNILIGKNFFDVIVRMLQIASKGANSNLSVGIDTLIARRFTYFLIQFTNACYAIHKSPNGHFHLFDPYGVVDGKPAGWVRCKDICQLKCVLTKKIVPGGESYQFYNFDITRISKAPKSVILSYKLEIFKMKPRPPKKEKLGKPFYEDSDWLRMDPVVWSRMNQKAANGNIRGTIENMWHSWDEEYTNDLWSLLGNINQRNDRFSATSRGKQTLANLVTAIGMTKIYELPEWNSSVVDSVLVNGENYFNECAEKIKDQDYELAMDDLLPDCSIFPFSFKVEWTPIVEGTMFLVRPAQFNLYKALRFFFANVDCRCGIIMLTKTTYKRQIAFGKIQDSEYFIFDCDCRGMPMFVEHQDVAYILRMTTLNRMLHVLTLTLRGGDFFIYEIQINDMKPLE